MVYKVKGKQNNSALCFVCGIKNKLGLRARFYACETQDGKPVLLTVIKPKKVHQSYGDRMHGGVISALLDESIGRAIQITNPDIWAVTMDLQVKYRKPTPLGQTLYIESKITGQNSRGFDGEGKLLLHNGTICATATAKFFNVDISTLPDVIHESNWFYVDEKLPKVIEIG